MLERISDPSARDCYWVIRPNQSLAWREAVWIYAAITLCCLGIGVVFALHGYWPVLPFAGLEVAVLGFAFHVCLSRARIREVVTVTVDVVSVDKGRRQPQEHWECPRAWARVNLEHSPIAWYPRRLMVAFQGQRVEVGQFLNEEERGVLADELQRKIRDTGWQCRAGQADGTHD